MKNYGLVYSAVRPEPLIIDEYSVYKNFNIQEISSIDDDNNHYTQYSYEMIQYDKNEYILLQNQEIKELNQQIIDTQLALCELVEG